MDLPRNYLAWLTEEPAHYNTRHSPKRLDQSPVGIRRGSRARRAEVLALLEPVRVQTAEHQRRPTRAQSAARTREVLERFGM